MQLRGSDVFAKSTKMCLRSQKKKRKKEAKKVKKKNICPKNFIKRLSKKRNNTKVKRYNSDVIYSRYSGADCGISSQALYLRRIAFIDMVLRVYMV